MSLHCVCLRARACMLEDCQMVAQTMTYIDPSRNSIATCKHQASHIFVSHRQPSGIIIFAPLLLMIISFAVVVMAPHAHKVTMTSQLIGGRGGVVKLYFSLEEEEENTNRKVGCRRTHGDGGCCAGQFRWACRHTLLLLYAAPSMLRQRGEMWCSKWHQRRCSVIHQYSKMRVV